MKIIFDATRAPTMTRDRWVGEFIDRAPGSSVVPTNYRDGGGTVRMKFANDSEAEWRWEGVSPQDAINGAVVAGITPAPIIPRDRQGLGIPQPAGKLGDS